MTSRLLAAAILLGTISLAVLAARWADAEYLRDRPLSPGEDSGRRGVERAYSRVRHDAFLVCAVLTLGVGAIVAVDARTWRRPASPVRIAGVVSGLFVVVTAAQFLLTASPPARSDASWQGLWEAMEHVPGAVLGAWLVAALIPGRRDAGWRERLCYVVPGLWLAMSALLIAHGLIFG